VTELKLALLLMLGKGHPKSDGYRTWSPSQMKLEKNTDQSIGLIESSTSPIPNKFTLSEENELQREYHASSNEEGQ